ncbi:hypothetical protein [Vitiosangium sp. GDMCC 1.1324]|uniref:hypothetical protein n=1 Tax=Vitiosangium sp. (strain GDMCC 1.1324) TaxID=2138576 RepID=UPI000D37AFAC|nr:hypothetical protein [Vitiosangium sp. GDMCC 1.1324]PTL84972.1 hypothetical protein DAT35_07970 [Vitiosangium sp. GDMCC 1.1324]
MHRTLIAALLLLASVARAARPEEGPASPETAAIAPSEETQAAESSPATETALSRVKLKDGQELLGRVVRHDADGVVLEVAGGVRMTLPPEAVERVEVAQDARVTQGGSVRFTDPARTRYLFGNSALMLRGGEGFFSQRELFLSMVSLGVTDHLTLTVGSALPMWVLDKRMINVAFGVKVGASFTERLHLAVGVESAVMPLAPSGLGLIYGAATYGTPDAHVTLSAGVPFELTSSGLSSVAHFYAGSLSGGLRLSKGLAGVTENWVLLGMMGSEPVFLNSLALRVLGERWAVDIGAAYTRGLYLPVPWVNFSWHWGRG